MQRQALLTRPFLPPDFTLVLNESVIKRPVGGARVMADQCRRLADMTDLPNFSLYIVPFSAGLHHGIISGPFTMLRFPRTTDGRETEPPIVYVESFTGALYLEKTAEVQRYEWAFERIMHAADKRGPMAMKHVLWAAIREMSG